MVTANPSTEMVEALKARLGASFDTMLAPTPKTTSRKAWGIDHLIWVGYFTAAKAVGKAQDLADEDIQVPIRYVMDKDSGEVKFDSQGRPRTAFSPGMKEYTNRARENYQASLIAQTEAIIEEAPELYQAQVARQQAAGVPVLAAEAKKLTDTVTRIQARQAAERAIHVAAEANGNGANSKPDGKPKK